MVKKTWKFQTVYEDNDRFVKTNRDLKRTHKNEDCVESAIEEIAVE